MKKILLMLAIFPCAASAYQFEVAALHGVTDFDDRSDSSSTGIILNYYTKDVETKNHPYAEAAFLERASNLDLIIYKSDYSDFSGWGADSLYQIVGGTWMRPGRSFYLSGDVSFGDADYTGTTFTSGDLTSFRIEPGVFVENILVSINVEDSNMKLNGTSFDDSEIGVHAKFVNDRLNVEGTVDRLTSKTTGSPSDVNTEMGIGVDFYPNRQVGIGADLSINSGDDKGDEGTTAGLSVDLFVTPVVNLYVSFEAFNADSGVDAQSAFLGAAARF